MMIYLPTLPKECPMKYMLFWKMKFLFISRHFFLLQKLFRGKLVCEVAVSKYSSWKCLTINCVGYVFLILRFKSYELVNPVCS